MPEQVIVETTGHRSCDGVKEYKCASSTFKRKASEMFQGTIPKKVEIHAKEKEENLINSDVKQNVERWLGEKVVGEKKIEDYNQSVLVVISTYSTKARFTVQKFFGTARVKLAGVPKKRFGSDKICSVNNLSVPNFIRAQPKFLPLLGPSER